MESKNNANIRPSRMTLAILPTPYKVLTTCIIATLAFGMLGALGQIIVHDIIPTFYSGLESNGDRPHTDMTKPPQPQHGTDGERGDLFADLAIEESETDKPFYKDEQFVWTLRWTHIHLFGINMIFIFLGAITTLLDASNNDPPLEGVVLS